MMLTDEILLSKVDAFLKSTAMAPTRFGIEALADGGLVKGLRAGRSLSLRNAARVMLFMESHRPTEVAPANRSVAFDPATIPNGAEA